MFLLLLVTPAARAEVTVLSSGFSREVPIPAGAVHTYELSMKSGQSADVVVEQKNVDLVVEIRGPGGALLDEIDAPTGRSGAEHAEVVAAESGRYRFIVKPYDGREPAGAYHISLQEVRSVDATLRLLKTRRDARDEASAWLRQRSAPLAALASSATSAHPVDKLATRARVIGLGEATHGSREFGDARLELTKRLVQRHGYRVITLEASAMQLAALEPYVSGASAVRAVPESGWIGRRTQRELIEWVRTWNLAHRDDQVLIIGVDAQENALAREEMRTFLRTAYGDALLPQWTAAETELASADAQSAVFGDSSVSAETRRTLFDITARLALDAGLLRARHGAAADRAMSATWSLTAFADYNGNAPMDRARDWYMADAVLRALARGGPDARAVYWAHNAHVTTRGKAPTGAVLRATLGCRYVAVAVTFGAGSFLAQVPNDPADRLMVSTLPAAADESIESVFAPFATAPVLAAWECAEEGASLPEWLRASHPLHWVGALWVPGSAPSAAFRPYDLVRDFDALLYFPVVTAEDAPTDLPQRPARVR
jgi:erythromycin esterase